MTTCPSARWRNPRNLRRRRRPARDAAGATPKPQRRGKPRRRRRTRRQKSRPWTPSRLHNARRRLLPAKAPLPFGAAPPAFGAQEKKKEKKKRSRSRSRGRRRGRDDRRRQHRENDARELRQAVERFVSSYRLDPMAAQRMRGLSKPAQRCVLREGPLDGRNVSAVLMSRIGRLPDTRDAEAGLPDAVAVAVARSTAVGRRPRRLEARRPLGRGPVALAVAVQVQEERRLRMTRRRTTRRRTTRRSGRGPGPARAVEEDASRRAARVHPAASRAARADEGSAARRRRRRRRRRAPCGTRRPSTDALTAMLGGQLPGMTVSSAAAEAMQKSLENPLPPKHPLSTMRQNRVLDSTSAI